jgi:tetratricopeptide (TPR) repeat protein
MYGNLVYAYLLLDRLEEAKQAAQQAQAHNLDSPVVHENLYLTDFVRHDEVGMQAEAARLLSNPEWKSQILYDQADSAAYYGQFAKARELTKEIAEAAHSADDASLVASARAEAAMREALAGNITLAREQAQAALAQSDDKSVKTRAAIALGLAGDVTQAAKVAADLAKQFADDTVVKFYLVPVIRGAAALGGGRPGETVVALAPAVPYELGDYFSSGSLSLYVLYLRGQAYLAQHDGSAAGAEFQKIIDHPGIVVNEPIGSLARLGRARAYALADDTAKARSAYEDFLSLWKDGDANLPVLKQAKAEYAKLQ